MKRLVVCLDGTGNATEIRSRSRSLTNVVHLARAITPRASDGRSQVVAYFPGIGTDPNDGQVRTLSDQALGRGLNEAVQDAYEFLVNNYDADPEAPDEIFIFGFSRGAFAARSLSAFTGLFGIIPKYEMHAFPLAWDYYQSNGDRQARDDIETNRALDYLATLGERLGEQHRVECERPVAEQEHPNEEVIAAGIRNDVDAGADLPQYRRLPLHFVGVWDTVAEASTEGLHTHKLAWNVEEAFQALATHEVRTRFTPVLWSARCRHQMVEQVWLPGAHADVGGGNDNPSLNSLGFQWVVNRAIERGLEIDPDYIASAGLNLPDPMGELTYPRHGVDLKKWAFRGWRSSATRTIGGESSEARHVSFDTRPSGPYSADEAKLNSADAAVRRLPLAWSTAGDHLAAARTLLKSADQLASDATHFDPKTRSTMRVEAANALAEAEKNIENAAAALVDARDSHARAVREGTHRADLGAVDADRVEQRIRVLQRDAKDVSTRHRLPRSGSNTGRSPIGVPPPAAPTRAPRLPRRPPTKLSP